MKVLDHGYLTLVESYGSDERIIEAARMSTGKGFLGWDPGPCSECSGTGYTSERGLVCLACNGKGKLAGDAKLLKFLYENRHSTPFEMAGMIIEVQAPIFVFREWHRHRTQSYNEMSARYIPLPDVNYRPTPDRCLVVNGANKQANTADGAEELTHESVLEWLGELDEAYVVAERVYQSGLRRGIPKELARLPVPVARYSRMRAHANLRNWLAFLTLRMDSRAQAEIRVYANAMCMLLTEAFPRTMKLFQDERGQL